jgi:hypothetical protein
MAPHSAVSGIGLKESSDQHRTDLQHGGSDGHLGGIHVPRGLIPAYEAADLPVDLLGDSALDERGGGFLPSGRAPGSPGSGRAAQIASLAAMSLSLSARNSL